MTFDIFIDKNIDTAILFLNIEIEFLIENASGVVPLEIKAGNHKTRSLDKILLNDDILVGYKFADQNSGIVQKKISLPLYMLMFF